MFIIFSIILVCGCAQDNAPSDKSEKRIGGQRDEHGCLNPAGYTYNKTVGACVKEWELNTSQKRAAGIAVDYAGAKKSLTISEVKKENCEGCFRVYLTDSGQNAKNITLKQWNVRKD